MVCIWYTAGENMNDWTDQPFTKLSKPKAVRQPQNFVEALKSIGGHTLRSAKDDLLKASANDMVSAFTGAPPWSNGAESSLSPDQWSKDWSKSNERDREIARIKRHQEILSQPVYDRRQEEIKAQIQAIQKELKLLAQELAKMGTSIEKAINEEIASPGTYHVNFFDQLRRFIILLRKHAADSQNWLELSYARKASKNVFWGNVNKSGSKYLLSSEHSVATSAG